MAYPAFRLTARIFQAPCQHCERSRHEADHDAKVMPPCARLPRVCLMRIDVSARTTGEPRWLVAGRMGGRHASAVVTYREDRIRIISVLRARDEEIEIHEV